MANKTSIEWCDSTFNPWIGCTRVGPGCDNCYAAVSTPSRSMSIKWGAGEQRHRTSASNWSEPMKWERNAQAFQAEHGRRQRVFCASLADVFDNEVDPIWRSDLFKLIGDTPNLDWLLLTKRVGNVFRMLPFGWQDFGLPQNVWLGATVVNQAEADRDIPKLLAVPAQVRFLSIEPMIGPVTLSQVHSDMCEINALTGDHGVLRPLRGRSNAKVHWVICGGESGHGARPMHPDWARSLRDQCEAAGVPFLFKQWGEWAPYDRSRTDGAALATPNSLDEPIQRFGKKLAGRLLDGVEHNGFPVVP